MNRWMNFHDIKILIIGIRKAISGSEEPPIEDLLDTNILNIISEILQLPDNSDDIRIMKVNIYYL
jgi:hypothetical protein